MTTPALQFRQVSMSAGNPDTWCLVPWVPPAARPAAGTAPWAPCGLQHFALRDRRTLEISQKSYISTRTRWASSSAWRNNRWCSFSTSLQSFLYMLSLSSVELDNKIFKEHEPSKSILQKCTFFVLLSIWNWFVSIGGITKRNRISILICMQSFKVWGFNLKIKLKKVTQSVRTLKEHMLEQNSWH